MRATFVLTVSESKRLIAKGVANLSKVKMPLQQGIVAIAKGTTNSYIVEEILDKKMDKTAYTTGLTLPEKPVREPKLTPEKLPDVVLHHGKLVQGLPVTEAIKEMGEGDVFIKGANALNYKEKIAGILIGHPTGGTIGATLGTVVARRINFIIPVGLEKLVCEDILSVSRKLAESGDEWTAVPRLFPITGIIVTEIEALKVLTGVAAYHMGSGGIGGAEGSVRLLVEGDEEQIRNTIELIQTMQGEPAFC